MAERTFKSAGFYDFETDLSSVVEAGPSGVPSGIIGTSRKGPAFVPITVRNFNKFKEVFGDLDPKYFGPYAANEFLKNKNSLTFLRVLGAGANANPTDIGNTVRTGQVKNAGFVVTGTLIGGDGRRRGDTQLLVARHTVQANEAFGIPLFTNNDSYTKAATTIVSLVRGVIMCATSSRVMVLDGNQQLSSSAMFSIVAPDDVALMSSNRFKLVISSTLGSLYSTTDGIAGIKVFTASFNPTDNDYFGKLLNRDPEKFNSEQHLLYTDFAVDDEIATATAVGVVSGSATTSTVSGDSTMAFRDVFGHFDTRYTTPRTPNFISQPFGKTEYDLFSVVSLDDGEYANNLYKISISNLKVSTDDKNPYGTFSVLVRKWEDTDINMQVLEQFNECSLNPLADNYVAKVIGDLDVAYNFDAESTLEQRHFQLGKYPNKSKFIAVIMNDDVENRRTPEKSLPFGFRGVEVLKTNDLGTDSTSATTNRLGCVINAGDVSGISSVTGSILPPIPFRFKVTQGTIATSGAPGSPGPTETTNASYFWGVKFERNTVPLDPNTTADKNTCLTAFTKFHGIRKLDALVTGSGADTFNNNKFTLARVALGNSATTDFTSSISTHMREAAYLRNGVINSTDYRINDGTSSRVTFGTLVSLTSSIDFNRFNSYAKFTTMMYGGFDGLNILDRNAKRMNDKACSFDVDGGASTAFISPGLAYNSNGSGPSNNPVSSYVAATKIMTDPMLVNHNILAIPGIRESYVTDYALKSVKDYAMAIYIVDPVMYDDSANRLYDDSTTRPSILKTVNTFEGRSIDNNYGAIYFPDVFIDDTTNNKKVRIPPSIAALAAYSFNDRNSYPWYAPAGLNRGALSSVSNTLIRLNKLDKDRLADARINPIVSLPNNGGFVIFGQKTLQKAKSSLDRVNVRRLLLEVKRVIVDVAGKIIWEQNTQEIKDRFIKEATVQLGPIQANSGIEGFRVVMDSSNNTQNDVDNNRLNGAIKLVPTKTAEVISLNYIISSNSILFSD
jgi:hypothetical protein